jgi:GIY-YIG catalytic domain
MGDRKCLKCGTVRPLAAFIPEPHGFGGYSLICRACQEDQDRREAAYVAHMTEAKRRIEAIRIQATRADLPFRQAMQEQYRESRYPSPQYIYGLLDPQTQFIHYVGRTRFLEQRLKSHAGKGSGENRLLREWVENLRSEGYTPQMQIIEHVAREDFVLEQELRWILQLIKEGAPLKNAQMRDSRLVTRVRESTCASFLTEPRNSLAFKGTGWISVKEPGDVWLRKRMGLLEATRWCLRHCPDELPPHLVSVAHEVRLAVLDEAAAFRARFQP